MSLQSLLPDLLGRLQLVDGAALLIGFDETRSWPESVLDALVQSSLVAPASPAKSLVCGGCEEDCVMPVEQSPTGRMSEKMSATGIIFRENDPSYNLDWHPAPARQFVIMLEGLVEIEVGSGEKRLFQPGDILLAEDTTGQGHRSRIPDGNPRRSIFVTLD